MRSGASPSVSFEAYLLDVNSRLYPERLDDYRATIRRVAQELDLTEDHPKVLWQTFMPVLSFNQYLYEKERYDKAIKTGFRY